TIAGRYGVECKTYEFKNPPKTLPAMIFVNDSHFVILERVKNKKFYIVDPAIGKYVLNEKELKDMSPRYYTIFSYSPTPSESCDIRISKVLVANSLKQIIKKYKKTIIVVILFTLLFQAITISVPFGVRKIVDHNLGILQKISYNKLLILVVGIISFQGFVFLLKNVFLAFLKTNIYKDISVIFIEKLLKLPLEKIFKIDKSDIIHRYNSILIIKELISEKTISIWLDVALMILSLFYVSYKSIQIGLLLLIIFAFELGEFFKLLESKQEKLGKEILRQKKSLQSFFSLLDSLFILKAKNSELNVYNEWENDLVNYNKASFDRARYFNLLSAINFFITFSTPIISIILFLQYYPQSSSGEIILLYMMVLNFVNPINSILASIDEILYGVRHYIRALEITTLDEEGSGYCKLSKFENIKIGLKNVNYKYELNSDFVLKDISITINPGEFVAIIGKSGSGKSTLAKLLSGYLSPTTGELFYNHINYMDVEKKDFRNLISFVFQNPFILDGSLLYNITLDRQNITYEDVVRACKNTSIYDDIEKLPLKFNTPMNREIPTLSGGQMQRVVLAREIITKPKILVLDEPTSALDVETERIVQESVESLKCTRILVTHRLNTIEKADKIIIMDSGKIIDCETHDNLYNKNILYREMYDSYMNKYQKRS
ncbi:peptidase domain-containing ABC transporter, partial [Streptococcus gallolyticus]